MKANCKAKVESAIGRPLQAGEADFIDKAILQQLRQDARENPAKFKAMTHAQRTRAAGNRAATNLRREQAVREWTEEDQDALHEAAQDELIKAGAKLNTELHEEMRDPETGAEDAAMFLDNVIAFSLAYVDGKSVAAALKSMQGSISHELVHYFRAIGAFTADQWDNLTTGADTLKFRRTDARLIGEEAYWVELRDILKEAPTYRQYANYMYEELDESGQAEEAVAKAIEVERARWTAQQQTAGHSVFRKALGTILRAARAVLKAVNQLTQNKQAALRDYFANADKAIRQGNVARQQHRGPAEATPPVKIKNIADVVVDKIAEEQVNDLVRRVEDPKSSASEILDAPIWDELRAAETEPTMRPEDAVDDNFWASRPYNVEQVIETVRQESEAHAGPKGPRKDKRAVILTGAPGAGKSSIAAQLAHKTRSAINEADAVKKHIPEWDGGLNDGAVWNEARAIAGQVMRDQLADGTNIILERIGDSIDGMQNLTNILRDKGYTVDVVHVRSDFSTRVRGAAVRFLSTGRWIPPESQLSIGNKPTSVHKTVIRNNMVNGAYEVQLRPGGSYGVLGKSGKPAAGVSRAVTAAAGGRLARAGQVLSGARPTSPREEALAFARQLREQAKGLDNHPAMRLTGGRRSKGADLTKLREAERLEKEGVDRAEIKRRTNWFRPDGKEPWQYTLHSGKITLLPKWHEAANAGKDTVHKLGDLIDTPAFNDYPHLKKVKVLVQRSPGTIEGASASPFGITMKYRVRGSTYETMFAHEIQHKISGYEKFFRGGNPSHIAAILRAGKRWDIEVPEWAADMADAYNYGAVDTRAYALYLALRDELRARDAEVMESMTPEQRKEFEPSVMIMDSVNAEDIELSILELIKLIPLKYFAVWSTVGGAAGMGMYQLVQFLNTYFTQNAVTPQSIANLEAAIKAGPKLPAVQEVAQEFGLTKTQARRFKDFAERYKPVAAALEKAGIDLMPKSISREQYARLRRALGDITDNDFLGAQTPLQKKYGGRGAAVQKFRTYARDEKEFSLWLENGIMDGGFVGKPDQPARPRQTFEAKFKNVTTEVVVNPTMADLLRLTKPIRGGPRYEWDTLRFVKDKQTGDVFVALSHKATHDAIVKAARNNGFALEGFQYESASGDYGGSDRYDTGSISRQDNGVFKRGDSRAKGSTFEDVFPNLRNRPMEARKSKAYNAPGGRKGAMNSSTTYHSIPPQPGFVDDIADLRQQLGMVRTKRFLGETIQDKGPTRTFKFLFGAGKWLDQLDHDAEQWLKIKWARAFAAVPFVKGVVNSYFPFGGMPDETALQILRMRAAGRRAEAAELGETAAKNLFTAIQEAAGKGPGKEERIANIMEDVRKAMTEANQVLQAHYLANLPNDVRVATVRSINIIDDIGASLVEHNIIHQRQYEKYSGHYLRRAYARYLHTYMPSAGTRASGAHYRYFREVRPDDVRLTDGEIKHVPFLVYLSIEQPLSDLAMYAYLNSILHYSMTAPSNPGWVLPNSTVMWGGKWRTLFWLAKEKEQNDKELQAKKAELSDIGGPNAHGPVSQALRAEIATLQQTSAAMERELNAHPLWSRALSKKELPRGYKQLPADTARLGDMAGGVVRAALYNDIMAGGASRSSGDEESIEDIADNWWNIINRNQKFLLTVANPTTHFRNIYSNMIMLARSGTHPATVMATAFEVVDHYTGKRTSPAVKAAIKYGAMTQTFTEAEVRQMDEFSKRIRRLESRANMRKAVRNATNQSVADGIMTALDAAGKITFGLKNWYANGMSKAYQFEDVLFKVAKIKDELDRGTPPALAALEARKHFFDYSAVPNVIRVLRNNILAPFVSFTYFASANFVEQVGTAPWRLAYSTYLPIIAMVTLFALFQGYTDDDDKNIFDRAASAMSGKNALSEGVRNRPLLLPISVRDSEGRTQYADIGYLLPEGALVGATYGISTLDPVAAAQALGVGGSPVLNAFIGAKTGIDPFRGMPIYEETDSNGTRAGKIGAFMFRQFVPSTYNYYLPPLLTETTGGAGYEAVWGTGEDRYGQPTQTNEQLLARLAGFNVYPSDFFYDRAKRMRELQFRVNELNRELRRPRNDLTPERQEARRERLRNDITRILEQRDRLARSTAVAARAESERQ